MKAQTNIKKRNKNQPTKPCTTNTSNNASNSGNPNPSPNPRNLMSRISGPLLFGLKLLSVQNERKTLPLSHNPKIHPFEELTLQKSGKTKNAIMVPLSCYENGLYY